MSILMKTAALTMVYIIKSAWISLKFANPMFIIVISTLSIFDYSY
ncbi:hypothetical protein [Paenibacillus sp. FSL H8-0034]